MSAALANTPGTPIHFRNSWILASFVFLIGTASLLMSPLMLIVALTEVFPLHGFSLNRAVSILSWLVGCAAFGSAGWAIIRVAIEMTHNHALLDNKGIQFDLRIGPVTSREFVRWDQIVEIQRRTVPGNTIISLTTSDNRILRYTGFTFYRPIKLVKLISAASGRPIQKVK